VDLHAANEPAEFPMIQRFPKPFPFLAGYRSQEVSTGGTMPGISPVVQQSIEVGVHANNGPAECVVARHGSLSTTCPRPYNDAVRSVLLDSDCADYHGARTGIMLAYSVESYRSRIQ